jgi:hypothetical protein
MHDHLAQTVLKVCPGLTTLSCWGCTWLTGATLAVCAQHCPQLRKLTLPVECPVTADGLRALVIKLGSKQRSLDFQHCYQWGDDVVLAIAERCPPLKYLRCSSNVSDAALMKLKERCVNLRANQLNRT